MAPMATGTLVEAVAMNGQHDVPIALHGNPLAFEGSAAWPRELPSECELLATNKSPNCNPLHSLFDLVMDPGGGSGKVRVKVGASL